VIKELSAHAHTTMLEEENNEDVECDRVFWLGEVAQILGAMCPAQARMLSDLSAVC
jgi:hypothetical protein